MNDWAYWSDVKVASCVKFCPSVVFQMPCVFDEFTVITYIDPPTTAMSMGWEFPLSKAWRREVMFPEASIAAEKNPIG